MPPLAWFAGASFVALAMVASWRQRDAWPFSHYPMFSPPLRPDQIVVFRIGVEDPSGEASWWRPRFFRLQDRLVAAFADLMRRPREELAASPELLKLVTQTRNLMLADGVALPAGSAVRFVRRRIVARDGGFETSDEVVARVVLPGARP